MYTHSKEFRDQLTPDLALGLLKEGNSRFMHNLTMNRNLLQQVNATADGQFPFATILSCMDSRTSAELIFDQGLGDIFSIRIAGNIVNDDILGSMEYATKVVGTKLILVLGHSNCGAIAAACNAVALGHLTGLLNKIKPVIDSETSIKEQRNGNNGEFVKSITKLNVTHAIGDIKTQSEIISDLVTAGKLAIAGGVYQVETGEVLFF
ncbi:MAG: carbonic anhydrase family protein [Chitinophagaceae bacterium]